MLSFISNSLALMGGTAVEKNNVRKTNSAQRHSGHTGDYQTVLARPHGENGTVLLLFLPVIISPSDPFVKGSFRFFRASFGFRIIG